jgi:hypothetical protein
MIAAWNYIWETKGRKNVVGIILAFLISSFFYIAVDWYSFYESRDFSKRMEATSHFHAIKTILVLSENNAAQASLVLEYIKKVDLKARISVIRIENDRELWHADNNNFIDYTRSLVTLKEDVTNNNSKYQFEYIYANRPPADMALYRAWTWSLQEMFYNYQDWWKFRSYNRSIPIYSYFIVLWLVISFFFKQIFINYHQLKDLKSQLNQFKSMTDNAINIKELNRKQVAEQLSQNENNIEFLNSEISLITQKLKAVEEDKSRLVYENDNREKEVDGLNSKLNQAKLALSQAEDSKIELIIGKEDNEKEINRLNSDYIAMQKAFNLGKGENLVKYVLNLTKKQTDLTFINSPDKANHLKLSKDSKIYDKLKQQLKKWIKSNNKTDINIADHHSSKTIHEHISKIDECFLNDYFVHVRCGSYAPNERGTIKVVVNETNQKDYSGTLHVVIDCDAGYCIVLSFNTRSEAPVKNVGFVLALMLRAVCKDFSDFKIKA